MKELKTVAIVMVAGFVGDFGSRLALGAFMDSPQTQPQKIGGAVIGLTVGAACAVAALKATK